LPMLYKGSSVIRRIDVIEFRFAIDKCAPSTGLAILLRDRFHDHAYREAARFSHSPCCCLA
jgi:hypothetical protein